MNPDLVLASALAVFSLPVAAAGACLRSMWRARRLNRAEACGRCGGPLYVPRAGEGPSLVQGFLHCAPCAATLRTRTRIALSLGAAHIALLTVFAGAAVAAEGASVLLLGAGAAAQTAVLGGGAVYLMRRRNRRALRELERRGEVLPAPGSAPPA